MLAIRLSDNLQNRLENLAEQTGRSKSFYVRAAIKEFLMEHEEYLLAIARLEKKNPKITIEEMGLRLGLDDKSE